MPEAARRWTSRSLGSRFAHYIFYMTLRYAGRPCAYFMLYFVVFFYTCWPRIRAKSRPYRQRRFGHRSKLRQWLDCYALHMNFGRMLVDRAAKGILNNFNLEASLGHRQILQDLTAQGRGLILLTAHVGCWQLGLSVLDHIDIPKSVVMVRDQADVDRHYFEHGKAKAPFAVIDPRDVMGSVLDMLHALRQGSVLCMMGDREFGSEKSCVVVNLLGDHALIPVSPYRLASATQAPLALIFSLRTGPGRGLIWVEDIIRVPPDLGRDNAAYAPFAQQFADALDRFIVQNPWQFFNFFDLWRISR